MQSVESPTQFEERLPRNPSVAIETHGCKLNAADSQQMARRLLESGFRIAGSGEAPDVFVLNSCTVTHVADRKARHAIAAARRRHPEALIVATGCYAERDPERVAAVAGVDLVVSNREKKHVAERIAACLGRTLTPCAEGAPADASAYLLGRTRASVRIQEGCDQVCAYCIVPRVRGRERSVPGDALVSQVNRLVQDGCQEVVLTGTQLGTYGFDLPEAHLPHLLGRLLRETGAKRLRVSSLQPPELTGELLNLWTGEGAGRLCPHFHVPLQAGSDSVLRRMRRKYTAQQFLDAVYRIRDVIPNAAVTTDIIAGFPGESGEDFESTLAVVERARFADAHVFPYSARPGTSAAHFRDQVPVSERVERAARLRAVTDKQAHLFRSGLVGQVRTVLWEQEAPPRGLTEDYVRAVWDGETRPQRPRANVIEQVVVTGVSDGALTARPLELIDGGA